jgi:hypothetical protein
MDQSDRVMVGSVVAAEVSEGREGVCDSIRYAMHSEREILGSAERIEFCADQELVVRGRYLVFFSADSTDSKGGVLLGALTLTQSFLDFDIDWVEVNTISGVDPKPLSVTIEEVTRCEDEDGFSTDEERLRNCRTIQARELVPLWIVIQRVQERHEFNLKSLRN